MSFRTATLVSILSLAACGGIATNEAPGDRTPGVAPLGERPAQGEPGTPGTPAVPSLPVGPYSGLVGTTDVSILYPLPLPGASKDFVRPVEEGNHGALLPKSAFDAVTRRGRLEHVHTETPSGYGELALVGLRIDPCSSRGNAGCRSEVRLVFQALYDDLAGPAATDGAIHVSYEVPSSELVMMMKQIVTLKQANGDLALHELAPHPILAKQGLAGPFAVGLRAIVLEHVGDARIGRITFFDHNFDPDGDGWEFGVVDRAGGQLVPVDIPIIKMPTFLLAGSDPLGPLSASSAQAFRPAAQSDSVAPLVAADRPAPGAAGAAALQASLDAALNVQNPQLHTAETTDCANCHLAEGARRLGEDVYGLSIAKQFTHTRSLARKDERTSVTNLHAFGYLHRKVSIMQRTANESVIAAEMMEAKITLK